MSRRRLTIWAGAASLLVAVLWWTRSSEQPVGLHLGSEVEDSVPESVSGAAVSVESMHALGADPVSTDSTASGAVVAADVETSVGGVDYDVVKQIVDSVGLLDPDLTVRSRQLNPESRVLPRAFVEAVRAAIEGFAQRDKQILASIQAALSAELGEMARAGTIPVAHRDLYPEIFDRIESQCRKTWRSRYDVPDGHDWEGDTEFQAHLRNAYCNELRRSTPHRVRIDVGATGATHVATYADCKAYAELMMRGYREMLETEVMRYLVSEFSAQGALNPDQCEALWARFMQLQSLAMTAKLELLR